MQRIPLDDLILKRGRLVEAIRLRRVQGTERFPGDHASMAHDRGGGAIGHEEEPAAYRRRIAARPERAGAARRAARQASTYTSCTTSCACSSSPTKPRTKP